MLPINFETWKEQHPTFMQQYVKMPEGQKWGRVICKWEEKPSEVNQTITQNITHTYAAAINLKNGDIYLDCRKRKIWAKCALYSLVQPIILTAKTVYHLLLPVSIPLEIYKTVQAARKENPEISKKELAKRCFIQVGKNFADIVRTPAYAVALTVIGIAGVIIGPLAPKTLYDIRATAGKMEKSLHWGDDTSPWILFKCFQPISNLMTIGKEEWTRFNNATVYLKGKNDEESTTLYGLTNLARALIQFRRDHRAIFNDCFQKYAKNEPYKSKATPPEA
jgi:hypothetical protein